ncbi:MAG: DUF1517 domain-containing protein [Kofleriaceae bacterium]
MKRWLVAIAMMFWCAVAWAGGTGGSMGGGSWSSGSHSSSSSGYSGGSHSYSSSGGGSYSYSSSGGSADDVEVIAYLVIGVIVLAIWFVVKVGQSKSYDADQYPDYTYDAPVGDSIDVTVLRIAVDGRSRKFVQTELARIAKIADTATDQGRVTLVREVALMLRRLRDAWVYGGAVNEPMRAMGSQKDVFDRWVNDARARFREETVRNEQGVQTATAPSQYTPRTDEGAGLILVSIIIAARRELFTVRQIGSGDDLRQALEGVGTLDTNNLVAVEIVWQPSEDADRMSSMELEAKYPPPMVVPITGALVGKTFCKYCAAPFPAELVSCPNCGAPNRET